MTLTARWSCADWEFLIRWHHDGGGQLHSSALIPVVLHTPYAVDPLRGGGRGCCQLLLYWLGYCGLVLKGCCGYGCCCGKWLG